MAKFTTRVELHKASEQDYVRLHEAMEQQGFTRTIKGKGEVKYQLPTAEYDLRGDYDQEKVLDLAKQAAAETGKAAWILVTDAKHRTWSGLPKVDEE